MTYYKLKLDRLKTFGLGSFIVTLKVGNTPYDTGKKRVNHI